MKRIALIAALPGELRPLVRGWEAESRDGIHRWRSRRGETEYVAICAGMGAVAAARAFSAAALGPPLGLAVSLGWAGSLRPDFAAGRICRLAGAIDSLTGERFAAAGGGPDGWAVTAPGVAGREEKRRLATAVGAAVVEMEAAAVARQARDAGIPFRCLKAVSDNWDEDLPDFGKYLDGGGRLRPGAFAGYLLTHPGRWAALARLGRNSARAARALAAALPAWLEETTDGTSRS